MTGRGGVGDADTLGQTDAVGQLIDGADDEVDGSQPFAYLATDSDVALSAEEAAMGILSDQDIR